MGLVSDRETVCYTKQGRNKHRYYKSSDVGRIAVYAQRSGDSVEEILAVVLHRLGYSKYVCELLKAIKPIEVLFATLVKLGGALAVQALINVLLQVISKGAFLKVSKIRVLGVVAIIVISSLEAILKAIQEIFASFSLITDGIERLKTVCILAEIEEEKQNGTIN